MLTRPKNWGGGCCMETFVMLSWNKSLQSLVTEVVEHLNYQSIMNCFQADLKPF